MNKRLFDCLAIDENTAEYAKKAKQTNSLRRVFEGCGQSQPRSFCIHSRELAKRCQECTVKDPVGSLSDPPASKGMTEDSLKQDKPIVRPGSPDELLELPNGVHPQSGCLFG
jgi:hypothetical protein